jgi:hypothetical protein
MMDKLCIGLALFFIYGLFTDWTICLMSAAPLLAIAALEGYRNE